MPSRERFTDGHSRCETLLDFTKLVAMFPAYTVRSAHFEPKHALTLIGTGNDRVTPSESTFKPREMRDSSLCEDDRKHELQDGFSTLALVVRYTRCAKSFQVHCAVL